MGNNQQWEDDPQGYDGWLEAQKENDEGERAIASYSKSNDWYFSAKLSLIGFLISFILFQVFQKIPSERGFFSLMSAVFLIAMLISISSSILWDKEFDKEFDKELDKLFNSDEP